MKYYSSWQEDEAFRDGRNDASNGSIDHFRDNWAWDGPDKAYYDGIKEQEEEDNRRRQYIQEERQEEARYERQRELVRQYEREQEDAQYEQYLEDERYNEQMQQQFEEPPNIEPDDRME